MNELEREIRRLIAAAGPISFDRFMELALYHPQLGYYCRPRSPFGRHGDYYTNAQLQPVFGRLIAQKFAAWEKQLDSPGEFTVVELGAGQGETAHQVRSCFEQIRYVELEKRRGALPERLIGIVFANEFFDALPVRVVGNARERLIGVENERLAWVEGSSLPPELAGYRQRYAPSAAPDQVVEVNLEALEWIEKIARSLDRGFVLIIDYGYTEPEIAGGRRFAEGSLMSYHRHTACADVLADPGERDITAHVNFTALAQRGEELGLRAWPLKTQAQFLLSIGQADEFGFALAASTEPETLRHRMLLKTLLAGLGETFRVLVLEKL